MPRVTNIENLRISIPPIIRVIAHNHSPECDYPQTRRERDCRCMKYFYITAAEGERYRVRAGTPSWETARKRARRLEHDLSPEVREQSQAKQFTRAGVAEVFELYIRAKENAQDQTKAEEFGANAVIGKLRTLKKVLVKFIDEWNLRPRKEKKVAPDRTVERLDYIDQLTTFWLEQVWRPSWFGSSNRTTSDNAKGTFWSKTKRRELVISVFHWAQANRYMPDGRTRNGQQCECVACGMTRLRKNTKDIQPTPPFELPQYELVRDSCALYEASYRDRNIGQLRISNDRLRCFIEVMRWCGPRISDTALMRKDAIRQLSNGKSYWAYLPIKNFNERRPVTVPIPAHLLKALRALPNEPGYDNDYFFWSGESTKRNAADPWQRALSRLWKLCPPGAKLIIDIRNRQKVNPSSHMLRNTFCVQCRLSGMSYSEIADAIGDTERIVRDHYSAYCSDYDMRVAARVEKMQEAANIPVSVPVDALRKRSKSLAGVKPATNSMVQ